MEVSIEELFDRLIELKKDEINKIWEQAGIVALLRLKMQVKAGDIAEQLGCSSAYVNQLATTFQAFPEVGSRNPELSFSHHKIASQSEDPDGWIDKATEHGWSTRQMSDAMTGKQPSDRLKKAQKLLAQVEKTLEEGGEVADWLSDQLSRLGLQQ